MSALFPLYLCGRNAAEWVICMKRLNAILNTIIGAFVGVFIGHGVYVVWNFKTRPELYAMQSAPWYTSILVYGAFTIVVLLICFVIKAIIKHKQKKKYANSRFAKGV